MSLCSIIFKSLFKNYEADKIFCSFKVSFMLSFVLKSSRPWKIEIKIKHNTVLCFCQFLHKLLFRNNVKETQTIRTSRRSLKTNRRVQINILKLNLVLVLILVLELEQIISQQSAGWGSVELSVNFLVVDKVSFQVIQILLIGVVANSHTLFKR
jgi:hypothetical protein